MDWKRFEPEGDKVIVDQFYRWVRLVLILSDLHLDLVQWIFRNELLNL